MTTKTAWYEDPSELPIDVAACDPLEGDLLFGLEDKPDEMRARQNYHAPVAGKQIEKEAASKGALDRLARQIEPRVTQNRGPRFRRYIARTQAAMQLGISHKEMTQMFYGGKSIADPFVVASEGYPAEARFIASELSPTGELPAELPSNSDPEMDTESNPSANLSHGDPSELEWATLEQDMDVLGPIADGSGVGGIVADPVELGTMQHAAANWLDAFLHEADVTLQPNDEVEDEKGETSKVKTVEPDGSVTVEQASPTGTKETKYSPDAIAGGQIKRKQVSASGSGYGIRNVIAEECAPGKKCKPKVPGTQRAPAGMNTDEDGNLVPSDETSGKAVVSVKVAFPNLERRDWSRRPPFVYGWYNNITRAVKRQGGDLLFDDNTQMQITAVFRNIGVARDFSHRLVKEFNLTSKEVTATIVRADRKTAKLRVFADVPPEEAAEIEAEPKDTSREEEAKIALQTAQSHAPNNPEIADWLAKLEEMMTPLTLLADMEMHQALAENPDYLDELNSILSGVDAQAADQEDAEAQDWSGEGKADLLFDPEDYLEQKPPAQPAKAARRKMAINAGDRIMALADDGAKVAGLVSSVVGDQADVIADDDDYSGSYAVSKLTKVSQKLVPLTRVPVEDWVGLNVVVSGRLRQIAQVSTMLGQVKLAATGRELPSWVVFDEVQASIQSED